METQKWQDEEKFQEKNPGALSKEELAPIDAIAQVLKEAASHFNLAETQGIIQAQKQQIEGLNRYVHRLTQKIKDLEIDK